MFFPLCSPDGKLSVYSDRLCPDIPRNIWEASEGPQQMAWSALWWMFHWKPRRKQQANSLQQLMQLFRFAGMHFHCPGSHRLFPAAAATKIPYDSPAPAFWHYSAHLFPQAGAPAQMLPSSQCSVKGGALPGERGQRGQAVHHGPTGAGAEEQRPCKPQAPTMMQGGCTLQPGLSPRGFRGWAAGSGTRRMSQSAGTWVVQVRNGNWVISKACETSLSCQPGVRAGN